jgi:tetratricopeptide (TPR) repeat protein
MQFDRLLHALERAQGDQAMLALTTVDLAYPDLSDDERDALKQAVEAAAIPHWFDEGILAGMLDTTPGDLSTLMTWLNGLTVIEPFPARGEVTFNVHEAARLALRKHLANSAPQRFRTLSSRAAACFENSRECVAQIEQIFHLLSAAPDEGADRLMALTRDWSRRAPPEDSYALSAALKELQDADLVHGRARIWTLLSIAWVRSIRGEGAQLMDVAVEASNLAMGLEDLPAQADSNILLGSVHEARGSLGAAQYHYEAALAIRRALSVREPANVNWQIDLGNALLCIGGALEAQGRLGLALEAFVEAQDIAGRLAGASPSNVTHRVDFANAHCRVGGVLETQGFLTKARSSFESMLEIRRGLSQGDPDNANWLLELASAYTMMGGVLQSQGWLDGALEAFDKALAIKQRLVEQDPSNPGWQRKLGMAFSRKGSVHQTQGQLTLAHRAFEETLTLIERVEKQDPGNASVQGDLASAHSWIGGVLEAQGRLVEARDEFMKDLEISRHLIQVDPRNADSQRDLATALCRVGGVQEARGQLDDALAAFSEFLQITERLCESDPTNGSWQRELATAHCRLGGVFEAQRSLETAQGEFEKFLAINKQLAEKDPSNAEWQRDLATACNRMGSVLEAQGRLAPAEAYFKQDLAISKRLAALDPSHAGWQSDLAAAHSRMGAVFQSRGQIKLAQDAFSACLAINVWLIGQAPTNTNWLRDCAMAHCRLGDLFQAEDKLDAALVEYLEDLRICRALAERDPDNTSWQSNLAVTYRRLAGVMDAKGEPAEALDALDEYLSICRSLVDREPDNATFRHQLARALSEIGSFHQAQGSLDAATVAFDESLSLSQRLVAEDSENPGLQADLAWTFCCVGGVLQERNRLSEARVAFESSVAVSRRLVEQDPHNTHYQWDLQNLLDRMGHLLQLQGQLAAARTAFQESLAICTRLAELDSGNIGWQRDLAIAYHRVGVILEEEGEWDGALAAFREDLSISQRLAALDPDNAGWQRDLASTYGRLAGVLLHDPAEHAAARAAFTEALAIGNRLAAGDPGNVNYQQDLALAQLRFGSAARRVGESAVAIDAFSECVAISRRIAVQNRGRVVWKRTLGDALKQLGEMLEEQGHTEAAKAAFAEHHLIDSMGAVRIGDDALPADDRTVHDDALPQVTEDQEDDVRYPITIQVHLIWHPKDDGLCRPLADRVYLALNRDPYEPLIPGIGIPVFYRCTSGDPRSPGGVPRPIEVSDTELDLRVALVTENLIVDPDWRNYLRVNDEVVSRDPARGVYFAVDLSGAGLGGARLMARLEPDDPRLAERLMQHVLLQCCRLLGGRAQSVTDENQGAAPLKLFLSHTKRDPQGRQIAKAVKEYLDTLAVDRFFDEVSIQPGDVLSNTLVAAIRDSALVCVRTDSYVSSPWCRQELACAKQHGRPMIVVDALSYRERRASPLLSHLPSVRMATGLTDSLAMEAMINLIVLEIVAFLHANKQLALLRQAGLIAGDVVLVTRPPEIGDIARLRSARAASASGPVTFLYPDPMMPTEEAVDFAALDARLATPTTIDAIRLDHMNVGLSLSQSDAAEQSILGLAFHIDDAMRLIARQLLAAGATLHYGGVFFPGSFTESLFEMIGAYNRGGAALEPLVNHTPWPWDREVDNKWEAARLSMLNLVKCGPPLEAATMAANGASGAGSVDRLAQTAEGRYLLGRSLYGMRASNTAAISAKIVLGGKTQKFMGFYPGILEEALMAINAGHAVYVLGGFGGATRLIADALTGKRPPELTLEWQRRHSVEFGETIDFYERKRVEDLTLMLPAIDYEGAVDALNRHGVNGLAAANGLTARQNRFLFETASVDAALYFIMKGLNRIASGKR